MIIIIKQSRIRTKGMKEEKETDRMTRIFPMKNVKIPTETSSSSSSS